LRPWVLPTPFGIETLTELGTPRLELEVVKIGEPVAS
jgi:hypothetical protein